MDLKREKEWIKIEKYWAEPENATHTLNKELEEDLESAKVKKLK